ncbi:hypothetical protein ACTHR6_01765 [Ralstonia holmesii]|uniref:hypothetical protein n=1 Tax=Ralstonia TaxID=48736 RepID=UPI0004685BC0|nr:hypothetical protein [Ralstonia pickettii]
MCERRDDLNECDTDAHCLECGRVSGAKDYEDVDDEFDPDHPMCPDCQLAKRLSNARCEYCDDPAEYETEVGYLCCDHHSDYVDGFIRE